MQIGRNALCHCGSGKKYKKCCYGKPADSEQRNSKRHKRPELSLHERNLLLLQETSDIFGFSKGKDWNHVRRSISGEQVGRLYQVVDSLWPRDTDIASVLPTPNTTLRALYLGDMRPELLAQSILQFSLYADEIFIIDPFQNPLTLPPEHNPLEQPSMFKEDTLKLLYCLSLLEPWIKAGYVKLIPDPTVFDDALRFETQQAAFERHAQRGFQIDHEDMEEMQTLATRELARAWSTVRPDRVEQSIRETSPDYSDEEVAQIMEGFQMIRERDPFVLDQPGEDIGTQILATRGGVNLDTAFLLTQLTGAFPYTNRRSTWKELLHTPEKLSETSKVWTPLTRAFQDLEFKFLYGVNPTFACKLRAEGRLETFRAFLRRMWTSIGGEPEIAKIEKLGRDFNDQLVHEYNVAQAEWKQIDRELLKEVGVTGTASGAAAIVALAAGTFVPAFAAGLGFVFGSTNNLIQAYYKRREFRLKNPMSVFIDLSKQN